MNDKINLMYELRAGFIIILSVLASAIGTFLGIEVFKTINKMVRKTKKAVKKSNNSVTISGIEQLDIAYLTSSELMYHRGNWDEKFKAAKKRSNTNVNNNALPGQKETYSLLIELPDYREIMTHGYKKTTVYFQVMQAIMLFHAQLMINRRCNTNDVYYTGRTVDDIRVDIKEVISGIWASHDARLTEAQSNNTDKNTYVNYLLISYTNGTYGGMSCVYQTMEEVIGVNDVLQMSMAINL